MIKILYELKMLLCNEMLIVLKYKSYGNRKISINCTFVIG